MTVQDERRLSELLHGVTAPPTGADIALAVRIGKRRRRRRRYVAVLSAAAVLVVGSVAAVRTAAPEAQHRPALGAPSAPGALAVPEPVAPSGLAVPPASPAGAAATLEGCRAEVLPLPSAAEQRGGASLVAVDRLGRFPVGSTVVSGLERTVVYREGKPALLPAGASGATGVNVAGTVVGHPGNGEQGWVYANGKVSLLSAPAGYLALPSGVNDAGVIVGVVQQESTVAAAVWRADRPQEWTPREAPGGGWARAVAADGTVAGEAGDGSVVYVWSSDGARRTFARPAGAVRVQVARVRGPWVVGFARFGADAVRPVRWDLATGASVVLPVAGPAVDVDVTGRVLVEAGATLVGTDGLPRRLPLPGGAGYAAPRATALVERGELVVGSVDLGESLRPVVWSCQVAG